MIIEQLQVKTVDCEPREGGTDAFRLFIGNNCVAFFERCEMPLTHVHVWFYSRPAGGEIGIGGYCKDAAIETWLKDEGYIE